MAWEFRITHMTDLRKKGRHKDDSTAPPQPFTALDAGLDPAWISAKMTINPYLEAAQKTEKSYACNKASCNARITKYFSLIFHE